MRRAERKLKELKDRLRPWLDKVNASPRVLWNYNLTPNYSRINLDELAAAVQAASRLGWDTFLEVDDGKLHVKLKQRAGSFYL